MNNCPIEEKINQHHGRCSKDRHRLITLFEENRTWSAAQLQIMMPHTNLATIYRNLTLFKKIGFIAPVPIHGNEIFFEKNNSKHHDHLVCKNCNAPECIPCPIPKLKKHLLELGGLCSQCK